MLIQASHLESALRAMQGESAVDTAHLKAAIRAIQGESDVGTVLPAVTDWQLARIIALAPDTQDSIRTVAALRSNFIDLVDAGIVADPDVQTAMVRLIGTREGKEVIDPWAKIAFAGWGRTHAVALINAVNNNTCSASAAAALIGPCDTSAQLLNDVRDIAFVLHRWGQSTLDTPTAWVHALSAKAGNRLISMVQSNPHVVACCLPWLPTEREHQMPVDDVFLDLALDAFAEASPIARAQHANTLLFLVAHANATHLGPLTRLACAMKEDAVWERVQTLIWESPDAASHVVAAAPWDALAEPVRAAILECADQSDICASVAAAQGHRDANHIASDSAAAFFAALHPRIWDALTIDVQRRWVCALDARDAHLAVRSIGPRPEILAQVNLTTTLVQATRRHVRDMAMLRSSLLPMALRDVEPSDAHALITAMRTPPDRRAFFVIASGHTDPFIISPGHANATLRDRADLALAITLQRCVAPDAIIRHCCAVLKDALHERTWNDLTAILSLLDPIAHEGVIPNPDLLIQRLAHPDRREEMRQALTRLAHLPPVIALPTFVALTQWTLRYPLSEWETPGIAEVIADALHAHSDIFLAIFNAIENDKLQPALLPLPEDPALANALRALASDDLARSRRIGIALRHEDWRAMLDALQDAPSSHAVAIWDAMDDAVRCAIVEEIAAASRDDVHIRIPTPIVALIRAAWDTLPQNAQQSLCTHPSFADLTLRTETNATTSRISAARIRRNRP